MALQVSLEQAVSNALAAYLASQLGCTVFGNWPDPDTELPLLCLTVLRAGPPQVQELDPKVVKTVLSAGNVYTYTHRIAQCTLPMQLDLWAETTPHRDDLIARTVVAMHQGKAVTLAGFLAAQGNTSLQPPTEAMITLQLAGAWAHVLAGYLFEQVTNDDEPGRVKQRIYRATAGGSAYYDLTVDSTSPQLNSIVLKEYLARALTQWPVGATRHIQTITASSVTSTDGTT